MRTAALLAFTLLLAGCAAPAGETPAVSTSATQPSAPSPSAATFTTISVGSNSAAVEGVDLAAAQWMATHPTVKVNIVRGLGSGGSIQAVAAGELDLTVASRPLKEKEEPLGLAQTHYVNEAIVLVAHPEAGVRSITIAQLVDVYAGTVTNWRELGGNDLPLQLVTRERDDSELERIIEHWPALDTDWGAQVRLVDTDFDKLAFLRQNVGAIGFADVIQVGLTNAGLVAIAVDDIVYDDEARLAGTYPLLMRFHLISKPGLTGPALGFHEFLLSEEWQHALGLAAQKVG